MVKALYIAVPVLLVFAAWMLRFDLVVASGDRGPIAYRLDRWTGTVAACFSINPCVISPLERE